MSTALATIAPRLRKLVLMLSSSHDGEVVGAARAIGRVLADAGTDWHGLADAIVAPPTAPEKPNGDWRSLARFCAARARFLKNDRERDFIDTLVHYRTEPSKKQLQWLRSIAARLARESAP
jgi:hypothetical protein